MRFTQRSRNLPETILGQFKLRIEIDGKGQGQCLFLSFALTFAQLN
jgi:hypothetical protein